MMRQKKVKKELVLVTYWDYLKHFGREEGRKKWREYKKKIGNPVCTSGSYMWEEPIKITDPTDKTVHKAMVKPIKITDPTDRVVHKVVVEDLEPLQKAILGGAERQDVRKTKADILECGTSIVEFITKSVWHKWIKPQIQKDMVDFVMKATMTSGEVRDEAMGGYKYAKKILKTIDKWVQDYTYLIREEEAKQKQGAKK